MRHGIAGRKFSRTSSHRKAMFANLATELIRHEYIRTTLPKAKDLRRVVEPLITKAISGTLHDRRQVEAALMDSAVVKKLFEEIAPRFKETPGGYTRVLKAGFRQGDAAPMAMIALTEGKKATSKKKPAKAAASKKEAAPKAEEKTEVPVEATAETPATEETKAE